MSHCVCCDFNFFLSQDSSKALFYHNEWISVDHSLVAPEFFQLSMFINEFFFVVYSDYLIHIVFSMQKKNIQRRSTGEKVKKEIWITPMLKLIPVSYFSFKDVIIFLKGENWRILLNQILVSFLFTLCLWFSLTYTI